VAFSPDGTRLATADGDKLVRVWEVSTGCDLLRLQHADFVQEVAFSPDGTRLATACADTVAWIFDAGTGRELTRLQHGVPVLAVAFSPDGTRLATSGCDDEVEEVEKLETRAWIWDAGTGRELTLLQHDGPVVSLAFSPDGTRLATGSYDTLARIWDLGTHLATGSYDTLARIFDAGTGRGPTRLQHDSWVNAVAFSPDGTRLATGGVGGQARIWDASTGRELTRLQHHGRYVVTFNLDGTETKHDHGQVESVAFSPDGTRLATGIDDVVRIWSPA